MAETAVEVKKHERAAPPAPMGPPSLDPWRSFRREMDRLFDQVWPGGFAFPSLRRAFEPAMDLVEDDRAFRITAELPGLSEKDIDVTISGDMLTIKGEKREEREEKGRNYYVSERRFGSFQRSFTLPEGVDRDKIEAKFQDGVLTLTLPKTPEAVKQQKKIEVKAQ